MEFVNNIHRSEPLRNRFSGTSSNYVRNKDQREDRHDDQHDSSEDSPIDITDDMPSLIAEPPTKVPPSSSNSTKDILSCGVCSEIYFNPITLLCQHTFCKECLLKNERRKCPMCRKTYAVGAAHNTVIQDLCERLYPEDFKLRETTYQRALKYKEIEAQLREKFERDYFEQLATAEVLDGEYRPMRVVNEFNDRFDHDVFGGVGEFGNVVPVRLDNPRVLLDHQMQNYRNIVNRFPEFMREIMVDPYFIMRVFIKLSVLLILNSGFCVGSIVLSITKYNEHLLSNIFKFILTVGWIIQLLYFTGLRWYANRTMARARPYM